MPSVKSLAEVPVAKINYLEPAIDVSQFMRRDRKLYFMSFEALHPISSYLHFKIEKSEVAMEEIQPQQQQVLMANSFMPNRSQGKADIVLRFREENHVDLRTERIYFGLSRVPLSIDSGQLSVK